MADQRSVFQPVDPQTLSGPFSSFLQPTQQAQQAAQAPPPVMAGKGTSLGYLASKFIQGASQGRVKAFEAKENQKVQEFNSFQGKIKSIYPSLTPAGQQKALQILSRTMGTEIIQAAEGGEKGKGKKGKQGEEGQGMLGHIKNFAKELGTGMTGGATPKGADIHDVAKANVALMNELYDENGLKPQYSREGVLAENTKQIQEIAKRLPPGSHMGEFEQAASVPFQNLINNGLGDEAQQLKAHFGGIYMPAPRSPMEGLQYDVFRPTPPSQTPPGPPSAGIGPVKTSIGTGGTPQSMHSLEFSGKPAPPPEPPEMLRRPSEVGPPNVSGAQLRSPREAAMEQITQSFYGPIKQVWLGDPNNPSRSQIQVVRNPRFESGGIPYYQYPDGRPVPRELTQGMGEMTAPHFAPRDPVQKIGPVKVDGKVRYQMYDPATKTYSYAPGEAYERPNMSAELAAWRRDDAFSNKEGSYYQRYAMNVQTVNAHRDAEAARVEGRTDIQPDEKKRLLRITEDARTRELDQAEKDRNQLLDILYKQHKKEFVKEGGGGESPTQQHGSKTVPMLPAEVDFLEHPDGG